LNSYFVPDRKNLIKRTLDGSNQQNDPDLRLPGTERYGIRIGTGVRAKGLAGWVESTGTHMPPGRRAIRTGAGGPPPSLDGPQPTPFPEASSHKEGSRFVPLCQGGGNYDLKDGEKGSVAPTRIRSSDRKESQMSLQRTFS